MDVVPPTGAICARPGFEGKTADTATMPAVIANAKPRLVALAFEDMLDSRLAETCRHSAGLADELAQRTIGEWPITVRNFVPTLRSSVYICQSRQVTRAFLLDDSGRFCYR